MAHLWRAAVHVRGGARALQPLRERLSRARNPQGRSRRGHAAELPGILLDGLGARKARRCRGSPQYRGARRTAALLHRPVGLMLRRGRGRARRPGDGGARRRPCSEGLRSLGRLRRSAERAWRAGRRSCRLRRKPARRAGPQRGAELRPAIHHVHVGNDRTLERGDQSPFAVPGRRSGSRGQFRLPAGRRHLHLPASLSRQRALVFRRMRRFGRTAPWRFRRDSRPRASGTRSGRPARPSSTSSAR